MQLLVSLGRVLVGKGLKPLAALVPFGSIILEIAQDTWEDYSRSVAQRPAPGVPGTGGPVQAATVPGRVEIDLRLELESLACATPAAVRRQVEQVAEQVAGDQPPEVRQALANYLAQVPAMLRRSMRRPSDPSGTTLPGNLSLRKGEDLVALLPPRPPRFNSGDRPLPGVDWVLDELLGVGGFGEVWKAHHADLKGLPPVALKFCLDEQAAKALRNEAGVLDQVMQQGRNEGIVKLQQAYLQAAIPCLEYEYIAGGDLAGLIQELHHKGRPSAETAGKIMRRLAAIIGTVHQQRPPIVHRDLKPANILVQKTSAGKLQFKVADFGIGQVTARAAILTSTRGGDNRSGLLTTLVQGSYTPLYASPQQVRGDLPDPRDDVYSLGVIWYQLLTGDLGSGAPSGMHWSTELAQRGMPQNQIDLLASCFESNPAHRPAHAAALAEQLSGLLAESAPPPPAVPAAKQSPPVPPPAAATLPPTASSSLPPTPREGKAPSATSSGGVASKRLHLVRLQDLLKQLVQSQHALTNAQRTAWVSGRGIFLWLIAAVAGAFMLYVDLNVHNDRLGYGGDFKAEKGVWRYSDEYERELAAYVARNRYSGATLLLLPGFLFIVLFATPLALLLWWKKRRLTTAQADVESLKRNITQEYPDAVREEGGPVILDNPATVDEFIAILNRALS